LIDDDPRLLLGGEHGLALFPFGCQWLRCYPSIARQLRQPRWHGAGNPTALRASGLTWAPDDSVR
jgi:hypothetical protein